MHKIKEVSLNGAAFFSLFILLYLFPDIFLTPCSKNIREPMELRVAHKHPHAQPQHALKSLFR